MPAASQSTSRARVALPQAHPGQRHVRESMKRFNWLAAGRRWRKTTLAMAVAFDACAKKQEILWCAPTYDQVRIGWEELRRACAQAGRLVSFVENKMVFTIGNPNDKSKALGKITFRSLDKPDNARGHTADGVVFDETADIDPYAWYEVVRPMLISTTGWSLMLGTPKGRNWFWQEFKAAESGEARDSVAWCAPTLGVEIADGKLLRKPHPLENPEIDFLEIQDLYRSMSERAFRQEILAEFIEDAGGVFRNVRQAMRVEPGSRRYQPGHEYYVGADWGRTGDFTVFTVVDATTHEVVYLDRFNQVDYVRQADRLEVLCEAWLPQAVVAESNAMGAPIIDALWRRGLPVVPFTTTNASKMKLIDRLALAFERGDISILRMDTLRDELEAFEAKPLPGGGMRYGAPQGQHDDCVMSLALAWSQAYEDRPSADVPVLFDDDEDRLIRDMSGVQKFLGESPKRNGLGKWL